MHTEVTYEPVEASTTKSYERRGARAERRGKSPVARQLWMPDSGLVAHATRRRRDALKLCRGGQPVLISLTADGVGTRP